MSHKSKVLASKILIIGYVWPEPTSSAAGLRTWNLIDTFMNIGWEVIVASQSKENEFTQKIRDRGIQTASISANDSHFDQWIKDLEPDFVIFDRFVTEEQFGWRVAENVPQAVRILDTQDLHFLRRTREHELKGTPKGKKGEWYSADLLREIGSIYRCDCTLLLSDFERDLLVKQYAIPASLLFTGRFHYGPVQSSPGFHERADFMMIGNFRHPPNADGILWFHKEIWPLIRSELKDARVFIYGAYPPKEMMNLSDPKMGFHVVGPVPDQFVVFKKHRVSLAPLRFGAGIKGKISDSWWAGTPVVATPIGAEGMSEELSWGGAVGQDPQSFAECAIALYTQQNLWEEAQKNGFHLIQHLYSQEMQQKRLLEKLIDVKDHLEQGRQQNLIGALLQHHLHRSTKYFSLWIEQKNK